MPRYIAFLRAINVGGHVVKMARLKELFESLGVSNVETFIASGNVIFNSAGRKTAALEQEIEDHLERQLGYEVKTFIRTNAEVSRIAGEVPFAAASDAETSTLYIGFLKDAVPPEAEKRLLAAQTPIDDFRITGRELYWRCRGRSSESTFSGTKLEKMLGSSTTRRNANTVRRLARKESSRG